jgi:hypothetical protein
MNAKTRDELHVHNRPSCSELMAHDAQEIVQLFTFTNEFHVPDRLAEDLHIKTFPCHVRARSPTKYTSCLSLNLLLNLVAGEGLVDLANLEGADGLEETSAVVAAGLASIGEHLLGDLTEELRAGVGEHLLDVDHLVDLLELAVNANDLSVLASPLLGAVEELDSRGRGGKLLAVGNPLDAGVLVPQVSGLVALNVLELDHLDLEGLLVSGVKVGGQNLDDNVGLVLLGIDVGIEVGLAGLDGSLPTFRMQ